MVLSIFTIGFSEFYRNEIRKFHKPTFLTDLNLAAPETQNFRICFCLAKSANTLYLAELYAGSEFLK